MNWKWLIVLAGFAVFIFPVVYCFYLQYNLHPEKIVRGKDHINGVKFILFGQTVERLKGDSFGNDAKNDYFFFFHSFLWAFVPWSILAYIAIISRLKYFFKRKDEWLTPATLVTIAIVLTFSGFKLPHYINIIFPATAVMTASWIVVTSFEAKNDFYYSGRSLPFNVATGCRTKCLGLSYKKLLPHSFRCSAAGGCLLFFKKSAVILCAKSCVCLRDLDGSFIFFTEHKFLSATFKIPGRQ